MKLYHGTNIDFSRILLSKCKPNKDFGCGFYLTNIRSQAQEMAIRRTEFMGNGTPIVQEYLFDENLLNSSDLKVKIFDGVSKEWAEFILMNRKARGKKLHDYDIVVGPVADDGVVYQLNLYMQRLITLDDLVRELTYKHLNNQYFFGSEKAINTLKRDETKQK
ncbi:MAG: DUF3990 domain-containing protein [Bacteroidaceae bacterium]|nr:DUF3990 domain-containing protein [Bacteroidaceae bacterium]